MLFQKHVVCTDDHKYVPFVVVLSSFMTYRRVTRREHHVEQKLLTLQKHMSSFPVFIGIRVDRYLVLCVVYCR